MSAHFVHLHNHTEYSFLDGAIRIDDLVKKAVAFGMPALAITDHGGLFGAVNFYQVCLKNGIKPVLGFEAYMAPRHRTDRGTSRDEKNYDHLILLARNKEGWKNLMRLSTIGYTEGFYYKPRIDMEVLREYGSGIIATSACVAGTIPRALLAGDAEKARRVTEEYLSVFGEGNFYFELQNHGIDDEIVAFDEMVKLGKEMGIPFIVANDAHYLTREDAPSHEILLALQTQTTLDDPKRFRFSTDEVYFKSPEEMAALFPDLPEAMSNTVAIAEACSVSLEEKPQLPVPEVPKGFTDPNDYITHLAEKGLHELYPHVTPGLEERLKYELGIICSMGFSGYFLIVRDFVRAARERGITVNTRGSASGSLVGHCIGISKIDPIKYDLLFERFLNPERISMPDIDIDFPDADRYKVIDYVVGRYGRDAVSQIINYARMKAKMVVRDVARVIGLPVSEADFLAKMVNEKTLEASIEANGELDRAIKGNAKYQELVRHAKVLEGLARQAGMHAGGVIIAPGPVVTWSPLFKQPQSDSQMTQFDMNYVEFVGLIKMDFLGLRTFSLLQETVKLVEQYHNRLIDVWKLEDGDEKTYELYARGETTGVFQFESQGMQDYLRKLKPTCIEDLIAMTALYRPGPMNNIDSFIHRKHGKEPIEYPHPLLKEILDVTYGIIVYQEQVMRIAQKMGGFSLGQADILRKAMGKKKADVMAEMGEKFVDGAIANKIPRKTAEAVFDLMARFAEYGFCKGHAASYAHVSYYAAYLKAHYPVEYMCASITSWLGNQENMLVMKNEAERMGIKVLPPDINRSVNECNVGDGHIRLGLGAIKGVGKAVESVLEARAKGPFASIFDLCARVDLRLVNKRCLEVLVCAGALDSLPGTRAQQFEAIERALDYGGGFQKDRVTGQTSLFDTAGENGVGVEAPEPQLPAVAPWPYSELLSKEKEVLNFYVSGHPLDNYRDEVKGFATMSLAAANLEKTKHNQTITVGGIITTVRSRPQRDGRMMAFLGLEDFDGAVELIAFGDAFEKFRHFMAEDAMVLVRGNVMKEDEQHPRIRVERVMALSESREQLARSVHIRLRTAGLEEDFVKEVHAACAGLAGKCTLVIHIVTHEGNEYRIRAKGVTVSAEREAIDQLRSKLGKENVWLGKNGV